MLTSPYYVRYQICRTRYWLVRDEGKREYQGNNERAGLLFHIGQDDYFSTLATVLRFYEESIENENADEMRELKLETIRKVIQDLLYLDRNFRIIPKAK